MLQPRFETSGSSHADLANCNPCCDFFDRSSHRVSILPQCPFSARIIEVQSGVRMIHAQLIALTSYEVLAGLATIYLGLIVCWGCYWLFFGMSEKQRAIQLQSIKSQIYQQQKEHAAMQRELNSTVEAFVTSSHRLQTMQLELIDLQHRIDQLESAQFELEATVAEQANGQTPTGGQPHASDQPSQTTLHLYDDVFRDPADHIADDATVAIDSRLGLVYTEMPADIDDLTQIWGIGTVNQQKLHEHGVYCFQQIADWTPDQCDAFNAILGFKGRIEREQWVSQAANRIGDNHQLTDAA